MNTNATQPNEAQAREALAKRLSRRLSSSVAFAAVMEAVDTAIKAGKLAALDAILADELTLAQIAEMRLNVLEDVPDEPALQTNQEAQ